MVGSAVAESNGAVGDKSLKEKTMMIGHLVVAIKDLFKPFLKPFRDARGLSMYETTAVVAMTAIVAAVAIPVALNRIEQAKLTRAANESVTIVNAMMNFFQATGKWPGEVEMRRGGSAACFLQSGVPATDPTQGTPLPQVGPQGLGIDASQFLGRPCSTLTTSVMLNINDFLVRKPSEVDYPNWSGPYMEPIASDPFDRAYIINVLPLIFATDIADPGAGRIADTGGKLGYGWSISAGADRVLQTALNRPQLDPGSDDIGKNIGARIVKSVGGGSTKAQ